MVYLQRLKARPDTDGLSAGEARTITTLFDPYAGEVIVEGVAIRWNEIEAVEVVKSPRISGPAGWLVRYFVHGEDRYHIGFYFGHNEAVIPNVTRKSAEYVVQSVAYYAPLPVRYIGVEGLSAVIDE